MTISFADIGAYLAIIGAAVTLVKTFIVIPLQKEHAHQGQMLRIDIDVLHKDMDVLRSTMEKLSAVQETRDDKINGIAERVVLVEASAKSAHKRIDCLEGRVNDASSKGENL